MEPEISARNLLLGGLGKGERGLVAREVERGESWGGKEESPSPSIGFTSEV